MPQVKTTTIIHFKDHGQDFLEWHVDNATGMIIGCKPFQSVFWVGLRVVNLAKLEVGGHVIVDFSSTKELAIHRSKLWPSDGTTHRWIKYPIEKLVGHDKYGFDLNATLIGTTNEGAPA